MNIEQVFNMIVEHTKEVVYELQEHDFKMTESLKDLGANSIDRSEVIMMTLEGLSLNISLTPLAKAKNMGELASLIHENL
jgi:polyketide biosynthesis acyl carrier protein